MLGPGPVIAPKGARSWASLSLIRREAMPMSALPALSALKAVEEPCASMLILPA